MNPAALNAIVEPLIMQTLVSPDPLKLHLPVNPDAIGTQLDEASAAILNKATSAIDAFAANLLTAAQSREEAAVSSAAALARETASNAALLARDASEDPSLVSSGAVIAEESVAIPEPLHPAVPDSMPSLLPGAYRAPSAFKLFSAPFRSGLSGSGEAVTKGVLAATPAAPLAEYANGQPFNPAGRSGSSSVADNRQHILHDTGLPPLGPQIVSGSFGSVIRHSLDILA